MKRYPSVILGTCVIPWDENYNFMEDVFRREVRTLRDGLTKHLYLFGTAGEGYAVSDSQFDHIAKAFAEEMDAPDAQMMLGVVSLSLSTIIERIERGCDLGFRDFQISLPSWGELSDPELGTFFRETCGRFPDCRFLHYNLPRTKRMLVGDDYARLSATYPNLVAVKTGGDENFMVDLLTKAPELQFFPGGVGYAMLRDRYECGLLISLSAVKPALAHEFFNARGDELQSLAAELQVIHQALVDSIGDAAHIDGAFDKMIYKVHDRDFPLRLLPPYESSTDEMFERFLAGIPEKWRVGDG